jgi:hypothetical protein
VCASKKGCLPLSAPPPNGAVIKEHGGAVVRFVCESGFSLFGDAVVYCDGVFWNGTTPWCITNTPAPPPSPSPPVTSCVFHADGNFCGWQQLHTDLLDWRKEKRWQFESFQSADMLISDSYFSDFCLLETEITL